MNSISTSKRHADPLSREIVALDGRRYHLAVGRDEQLHCDTRDARLYLEWLEALPDATRVAAFNVLTDLLGTHSPSYASLCSYALSRSFDAGALANPKLSISDIDAIEAVPKGYLAFIRPTLLRLAEHSPALFDDNALSLLSNGWRWEESGNGFYFALVTNCAERGALTEQELTNLHAALNRAFTAGNITLHQFAVAWMFIGTGLRPVQIARMTRSDVQVLDGPNGKEVNLNVPLAKGEKTSRREYWLRRAPTVLADILIRYLSEADGTPGDPLFAPTSMDLRRALAHATDDLDTYSSRLGTRIPITPYRFRYTLGTRALAQGASDWEVARLLTHRTTTSIVHYRASMPMLQRPIRDALEKEMGYFARAFQGRLIRSLDEATRKDEGEAEILDFIHLTSPASLGACGTRAACYQHAPISCLTCHHFEPLRNAPWGELRARLIADAEKESDPRIQGINFNALSAVDEIMALSDKEDAA